MGRPNKSLLYYWKPIIDGEYQVIVHELQTFISGNEATVPLMEPPSIVITNKPGVDSWELVQRRMETLPPCQHVRKPGLYTQWDGDWFGPDLPTSEGSLRTGWFFLPGATMNCKIEMYNDEDLSVIPEMKSIYVIGSSKERGVFLSLVDMILHDSEKEALEQSVISKCWGRAYVTKSNMKVLYQDWRSNFFEPANSQPNVICHDDKVVREGGSTFVENGFKVWEEIFQERSAWPSVILMSIGGTVGFDGEYDLQRFITSLPPAWEGTLFLTDATFSARDAGRGTIRDYEAYRDKLMDLTHSMFDRRVQWLDGMGVSREMRLYAEDGPDHVSRSQHFHDNCNVPYGNLPTEERRMMICSNITENVAQLLLNHALGPKQHFVEQVNGLGIEPDLHSEMTYCHACPEDMLPFHITPYPDMTCAKSSLHERRKDEIKKRTVPQTCPNDCLRLKVQRYVPTQSGNVHERICPMSIFLPAMESEKVLASENEVLSFTRQLHPLGIAVIATVLLRFLFRGNTRLHVCRFLGIAQTQLTSTKLSN